MAIRLTPLSLTEGVWTAQITGVSEVPELDVRLADQAIGFQVIEDDAAWQLLVQIPPEAISDGINVISVHTGQTRLGGFIVAAGDMLQDDLRAQLALLRAEVDVLKATIRRLNSDG